MAVTVPPAGPEIDVNESGQPDGRSSGRRRRSIWIGGALMIVFVGGMFVWLSAGGDGAPQTKNDVPLVKAAESPVKVRPEDPGGMHVAHRDKLIYQRFEGDEAAPAVERLLSAPEEPLTPPRSEPETSLPSTFGNNDEAPLNEFIAAPPEEAPLAQPIDEFLNDAAPGALSAVETAPDLSIGETSPAIETAPDSSSVAMAAPRPRPSAPPPPPKSGPTTGLSAPARAAQSLLMGTNADVGTKAAGYAIQLGSFRSRQEANVEWERLRRTHSDLLGSLRPTVLEADLGQRGTYYRLRAGPIAGQNSTRQVCHSLVDRKVACIVVQY